MAGERQTEPHQAEELTTAGLVPCEMCEYGESCIHCLGAEVARLRAERDTLRSHVEQEQKLSNAMHLEIVAAEARVAELEQANDDMRGNLEAERAQAAVEIEQLRQAQNRVAELTSRATTGYDFVSRQRDEALARVAELEAERDRAVTERTAALEAALREAISWSYGEDVTPERRDEIERKFLAPTRTQGEQ